MYKAEQKLTFWERVLKFLKEITVKQIGIVLIVGVLCAALWAVMSLILFKPIYSSSVTIAVMNEPGSKVSNIQNLSVCYQLARTLAVAGENLEVAENTVKRLNLSIEPQELLSCVNVTRKMKTMLVRVRATDTDPELAQQIADVYAEEMLAVLGETLFIHDAKRMYGPTLLKSYGGLRRKALICGFLGSFAAICAFFFLFTKDLTVKVATNLASFEKPVLGEIPVIGLVPGRQEVRYD